MSDQSTPMKPPLGVGMILGDSFSQFFSGFLLLMAIIFVPTAILLVAQEFFLARWASDMLSGSTVPGIDGTVGALSSFTGPFLIFILVYLIVTVVIWGAAMVGIGDRIRGKQLGFASYYLIPLMKFPQLVVLYIGMMLAILIPPSLVFAVLASIGNDGLSILGLLLAFALGLYLFAAFSPALPEILLGTAGWGSLSRALSLSRGYRWRIAGVTFLFFLILSIVALVIGLVVGAASFAAMMGGTDPASFADPTVFGPLQILLQILNGILTAAITGLSVTFSVVLYNRLLEIKEGPAAHDLEQVFE